ncbi:nucleotide exchange factor GrpE [Actinokineospora iranica]|uniref:GrpE protein n=1 Tax=Actinokineospora iranica TaxID=1271860 RepID=A0A1G6Q0A5_9PSEU|nr:nucleotide exchange factor GrpE [Actinokineospora iranica]SDC85783.1 GrpE protein [Actinokineospora iranica]
MASWFKGKRKDGDVEESTIEVRAQVIADAVRAGEQAGEPAGEVELVDDFRVEPALVSIAPEVYDQAVDERRALVALCLYAHDRARSSGVAERIEEGLAAVGVTALRPDGDLFDPAFHEAGGTVGTDDESLDGTVAETEVVGFSDRGQVLRPPIVTVYTGKAGQA